MAKRMLVLLLIVLKETGPTAACGDTCTSSFCSCTRLGLRSVPQFLPTTITSLNLWENAITTLSQSAFSRYSSLTWLELQYNQISVINSGAFHNLTSLTGLNLDNNQLTSLRADMFVGLDSLQYLYLHHNNIRSIEERTFVNLTQLRTLQLHNNQLTNLTADMFVGLDNLETLYLYNNNIHSIEAGTFSTNRHLSTLLLSSNHIDVFPSDFLLNLNSSELSELSLSHNRMETLPPEAYDILTSMRSRIIIGYNPWQCDCRMLPFRRRMTGFYTFEYSITCYGPTHLQGKSLVQDVNPDDLICEETITEIFSTPSTSSPVGHSTNHYPTRTPSITNFHVESSLATEFQSRVTVTEGSNTSSPDSFSLPVFLSGLGGILVGAFLTSAVYSAVWCKIRRRKTAPNPEKYPRYRYARRLKTAPFPELHLSAIAANANATAVV
ncbi:SLIT and NTRK-like protein 2 [Branchiostoma floridae]|uniref:SLIT and NTRK-like protein 2 n=1 Tax=Branchiostoma floridae TaxID=7739 RepID=A0A9J7HT94_BRAFL|nr:SLIT and NTRK-like protein 2 [Branchiostoma floridae]